MNPLQPLLWVIIILLLAQRRGGGEFAWPEDWGTGFVVFLLLPSLICFSLFFIWCLPI